MSKVAEKNTAEYWRWWYVWKLGKKGGYDKKWAAEESRAFDEYLNAEDGDGPRMTE